MPRYKNKPKVKTGEKITTKQKIFARQYIKNKFNATKTALEVYNPKNKSVASAMGSEILANPKVKAEIQSLLDDAGLTKDKIFKHLNEAIVSGVGRDSRNSDALRGLDMVLKLTDAYPTQKRETRHVSLHAELQTSDNKQLNDKIDAMQKRLEAMTD